jgi:hypothetical protein
MSFHVYEKFEFIPDVTVVVAMIALEVSFIFIIILSGIEDAVIVDDIDRLVALLTVMTGTVNVTPLITLLLLTPLPTPLLTPLLTTPLLTTPLLTPPEDDLRVLLVVLVFNTNPIIESTIATSTIAIICFELLFFILMIINN